MRMRAGLRTAVFFAAAMVMASSASFAAGLFTVTAGAQETELAQMPDQAQENGQEQTQEDEQKEAQKVVYRMDETAEAAAEETTEEVTILYWDDVKEEAGELDPDGEFVQIGEDIDLYMWVPSAFYPAELTDEELEDGTIGLMSTEGGEAMVGVIHEPAQELDLLGWREVYIESGYEETSLYQINDIPALVVHDEEEDTMRVVFLIPEIDETIQFIFCPISDEDYFDLFKCMIHSLRTEE